MFWIIWTVVSTPMYTGKITRAIYIATPIIAFGGFVAKRECIGIADCVTSNEDVVDAVDDSYIKLTILDNIGIATHTSTRC